MFGHQLGRGSGADETLGHLTMQRLPHGSRNLVVERLADEVMAERQPIVVAREHAGVQRYLEILKEIGGRLLEHGRELGDGESGTEHRSGLEHGDRCGRKGAQVSKDEET